MAEMKLHFPPGNIIGGVNCLYLRKSWHIYKCKNEISGYSISRKRWTSIENYHPKMCRELKKKILITFLKDIRAPIYKAKQKSHYKINGSADHQITVAVKDIDDDELFAMMNTMWCCDY